MFCSNCGAQVDGKFCTNCGTPTPITQQEKTISPVIESTPLCDSLETESAVVSKEIVLKKEKMLGRMTYKTITTVVTVNPKSAEIKMDIKKIFRKVRTYEKTILLSDIQKASIRTVMDFWDALYAIIFALLGLSAPILFLGTAVCLWCGYGKEIEILLSSGEKLHIQTSSGNSANSLVSLLNK